MYCGAFSPDGSVCATFSMIVTHRPEFEPQWIGRPYVAALNLNRLGEREIATLIDSVTGNKLLSERIRRDIIERTDGIPLFVEEMTKAVLEAESEGDALKSEPLDRSDPWQDSIGMAAAIPAERMLVATRFVPL
jgi:hypothetical protein